MHNGFFHVIYLLCVAWRIIILLVAVLNFTVTNIKLIKLMAQPKSVQYLYSMKFIIKV